jgi:superfamily II DNA or RNA helicase
VPESKLSYEQLLAENAALQKEITLLRQRLCIEDSQVSNPEPSIVSESQEVQSNQTTNSEVIQSSTAEEKIELFMMLFRGRNDVYAKRWYSTKSKKSGYSPVCLNEWDHRVCDKLKYKCNNCPHRNLALLDRKVIYSHLSGQSQTATDVVGLYPMTADECCYFLAIDFDDDDWQKDVDAFRCTCAELGVIAHVERSRSGNGAHVWFFFENKIPASIARKFGSALLTEAMSRNHEIRFNSYDRLFPNQDTMPNGGFGNLIALPLQGFARKSGNSLFVDESFLPYYDQWAYFSGIQKLSIDTVKNYISRLCGNTELGVLSSARDDNELKPWELAKPQIELTSIDFFDTVKIIKANMLHIDKTGISQKALNRLKRLGAFRNPDFYRSQAMRLPTYNKPRIIDITEETERHLSIPRGCEDELLELLCKANAQYVLDDMRNPGNPIDVEFNGILRPEQVLAANKLLKHETGILSATTAFGKTVVASYVISQRKTNALILVHTSALLEQWQKSLSQFLIINETLPENLKKRGRKKELSIIGQLGNSKNTLVGKIDIAIMQSLVSGEDVKELVRTYGLVIVDECHHVSAVSFEKILKIVNAKFVYGLTATPTRRDGQQPIIFMQCGDIRYQVSANEQAAKSSFERFVVPRFTSFKKPIGVDDSEFGITQIYSAIAINSQRNKLITTDVLNSFRKGRTPIVLTQRADHVGLLADVLEKTIANVICLTGGASAKEKREVMERLHAIPQGEQFVIIATGKYVGEGFDEPRLDALFLAAPISWKGTLQQYAGRLHRTFEGKENVIIYDYVDVHVKMLEKMYHKRVSGYSSMGYRTLNESVETEKTGCIFDSHNFISEFERDIQSAKHEIFICSPYLSKTRTAQMMARLSFAQLNGVRITIITRQADSFRLTEQPNMLAIMQLISDSGITVISKPNIHQKFAVIDQNIIWYGSINLLSYGSAEESIVRFENSEIASELLATTE